jgi:CarD family transcriptional regulator
MLSSLHQNLPVQDGFLLSGFKLKGEFKRMAKSTKSIKSAPKSKPKSESKVKLKGIDQGASKTRTKSDSKTNEKIKVKVSSKVKTKPNANENLKPKKLKDTRSSIKDTLKASSKIPEKNNNKENLKQNQKLLFSPGDFVVYPTHGVGRVTNVEMQEIAGYKLKLFVISFDEDRMTLRVPIAKASTSGLRKLTSRKKMDVALETLKGRARVKRTMWSRRAQEYEAKINSGDPLAIAEVVRDLHRKTGQPEQSFSERQIFESACHRLAMELAAIEKIDVEAATEKMEDLLKAA